MPKKSKKLSKSSENDIFIKLKLLFREYQQNLSAKQIFKTLLISTAVLSVISTLISEWGLSGLTNIVSEDFDLLVDDSEDWLCPFDHPEREKVFEGETFVQVRKDKFLFSISPFGPNNQFIGFRDAVLLAYYLNRTLVLPWFVKHRTDSTYEWRNKDGFVSNLQHPTQRLDMYSLSKYIPIVTMGELKKEGFCKNGLDLALYARNPIGRLPYQQLDAYDAMYRLDLLHQLDPYQLSMTHPQVAKKQIFPEDVVINKKYLADNKYVDGLGKDNSTQLFLKMNNDSIQAAYGNNGMFEDGTSEDECAIYLQPFRNVQWGEYQYKKTLFDTPEQDLIREMILATQKPLAIRVVADELLESAFENKPYAAIHWRYDIEDFGAHCSVYSKKKNENRERSSFNFDSICEKLANGFDYAQISDSIAAWMLRMNPTPEILYIATTKHLAEFAEKIKQYLEKKGIARVFYQNVLESKLNAHFGTSCPGERFKGQIHDFISQLEMEICMRSEAFASSEGSSWSINVQRDRFYRDIESIHDVTNDQFM